MSTRCAILAAIVAVLGGNHRATAHDAREQEGHGSVMHQNERICTHASGRHRVEGSFVALRDGQVQVRKHDGELFDIKHHLAPVHLEKTIGKGLPIAYALDGYPIFGYDEPDGSKVKRLDTFNRHEDDERRYHYHATKPTRT